MNYKKIYDSIIEKRKNNPIINDYKETHHIVPRCLGGTDNKDNLITLTAREHFICHYLLTKIYPKETFEWYKMNNAFMMMKCNSYTQDRYYNSRLYEALKGDFSGLMSVLQKGKLNSQYGMMWIHNKNTKESKKIPKENPIPEGWEKGRRIKNFNDKIVSCKYCKTSFPCKTNKTFCSSECKKKFHHSVTRGKIDNNIDELINAYSIKNSVTQVLKDFNINNSGHSYLTSLLRQRGFECKNGGNRRK